MKIIDKLKSKYHHFMMKKAFDYMNYNGGIIEICADYCGDIKFVKLKHIKSVAIVTDNSYPTDFDASKGFIGIENCTAINMKNGYLNNNLAVHGWCLSCEKNQLESIIR